ncbi:MAG TPA: N-terminal phage integrase SAM-like domain-containing protein [Friedmanniella sp.]
MIGRPRTPISAYGDVSVRARGTKFQAMTRYRDLDGQLRWVRATATSQRGAWAGLRERLLARDGSGHGGLLHPSSRFTELVDLWLADLHAQDISEGTKENYRDDVRLHVLPAFAHHQLAEITTGRVERFLQDEAAVSSSRAKHSCTMLNLLFAFALRHDAIARNPVESASPPRGRSSPP